MAEARLHCLSPEHAEAVVSDATRPGDATHTVRREGAAVVIGYFDPRWPMDVAERAFDGGHCDDSAAGDVIERL